MRKSFIILALLVAFNFASPVGQNLTLNTRHVIEYVRDDNRKDLTDNEILRNKVIMYMRLQVLLLRVGVINNSLHFNTS